MSESRFAGFEGWPVIIRYATVDDASGIALVRAESWLGAYRGIVPDEYLDAIDVDEWAERQRRNMEQQSDDLVAFVAETQGVVAGWAVGGPNREEVCHYAGELYAIYLLPEYQRRGIGRKLAAAVARWLMDQSLDSMILWVLEQNHPARHFYKAMGGRCCGARHTHIAGISLPEVAYGWDDLQLLGAASCADSDCRQVG